MSDCKKIHALLPLEVDGGLSASQKALVNQHLEECAEARREMDQLVQMRLDLRNLPEPHVPHDLHLKIMGRLVKDERPLPVRLNFWARYSWVAAAAAALAFIILNPFTQTREGLKGPIAQKVGDEKLALNTQAGALGQADAVKSLPGTALGNESAGQRFAMAQKWRASKTKEAAVVKKGATGTSAVGGTVSTLPTAMVVASKPAEKDLQETETYSKRMEASEVAALPQAFPAAAPPAAKKAEEAKAKESRQAGAALSTAATSNASYHSADVAMNEPVEPLGISTGSWNGFNSPSKTESRVCLTDEPAFRQYWQTLLPGQTPPRLDFTKQAVVVLLAGEKPTAGYSIFMTSLQEQAGRVAIHYRVSSPPSGVMVAQVLTRPWCMEVIPKPAKAVVFIKD